MYVINFQKYVGYVRTICGVMVEDSLVERDMSVKLGQFQPLQLVYFTNLQMIDISGMNFISSQDFTECVQACSQLKDINLSGCTQFHEFQLVRMFCPLLHLEKVDVTSSALMQYVNAFIIVTTLKKLKTFKCDPKYPMYEWNKWKWLIMNFNQLKFGASFRKLLSNH